MQRSFSKKLQWFYGAGLFLIGMGVFLGAYYFWSHGGMNLDNFSRSFESSLLYENLSKGRPLERINQLANNNQSRIAFDQIQQLAIDLKKLDRSYGVSTYDQLKKELTETRNTLSRLAATPDLGVVFSVLNDKVEKFEKFVVDNNWKTLSRISKRMKLKTRTDKNFYVAKRIDALERSLADDIKSMADITRKSVLSEENKSKIYIRLDSLKTESSMLMAYMSTLNAYRKSHRSLDKTYKNWFSQIGEEISLSKISMENNSKKLLLSMAGLGASLLFLFIGGIFLFHFEERKNSERFENTLIQVINEKLLPLEDKSTIEGSASFRSEFEKSKTFVHRRMSFGTIFGEALPLSSILLDSNLHVIWANPLFYDHWKLSEYKNVDKVLTWDYLQSFTNLGEEDPIIAGLKSGIGGIFQIQVRKINEDGSLPYEMYVSPVEYAGQKRVMAFFYPLRSMEETLSYQTKAIVGPVMRSLDALQSNSFSKDFKKTVQKDFEIAGIENLFERFQTYNEFNTNQRNGLMSEIERLEDEVLDYHKLIDDVRATCVEKERVQKNGIDSFKESKNLIVQNMELRDKVQAHFEKLSTVAELLSGIGSDLLDDSRSLKASLDENNISFGEIVSLKGEFKQVRKDIEKLTTRVFPMVRKMIASNPNYEHLTEDIVSFEGNINIFSRVSQNFEVTLSKLELIFQAKNSVDLNRYGEEIDQSDLLFKDLISRYKVIEEDIYEIDDNLISALQTLYSSYKENNQKLIQMKNLIGKIDLGESEVKEVHPQINA